MEIDQLFDIPGGDEFEDVTQLFAAASEDMDSESLFLMDGFTLMDAMGAFEIGEPRMDSGMLLEQQHHPSFNPSTLMLPEEVCWIIERTFACEMEWHTGNMLSQTVFTLLYVHHLSALNPDFAPHLLDQRSDTARPPELVTLVLRAAVFALLKSCDFSWRELSKGKVHEIEDWFGEKCDVSLLEGVNSDFVINKLDDACTWLRHSNIATHKANLLCDRLLLRQAMMRIFKLAFPLNAPELRTIAISARGILQSIRNQVVEPPSPESPAWHVLDPYISRRLSNFMPVRVIPLAPQNDIWDSVDHLLDGLHELSQLLESPYVVTWEVPCGFGPLIIVHIVHIYDPWYRNLIFGKYAPIWLIDRFFHEAVGLSYGAVLKSLNTGGSAAADLLVQDMERRMIKLLVAQIRCHWHNPPRRRRHLAKSVLQWHEIHDLFLQLHSYCAPTSSSDRKVTDCLPKIALMRRLSAAREVILSGFQQDLYGPEEIPIAYWFATRVLEEHLVCIDEISDLVQNGDVADEITFQRRFLTALQVMLMAMCVLTYKPSTQSLDRTHLNFRKRYKWALSPAFHSLSPAHPLPDLQQFSPHVIELQQVHTCYSPTDAFKLARDILQDLICAESPPGLSGRWHSLRQKFVRELTCLCERSLSATSGIGTVFTDQRRLKWQNRSHPWFPDFLVD
ncbi:uncharacterized protein FIBRA_06754 [Fibroporia radiculosa]|uniref:Mak10 subunit, NatC N(Alpha)-terminal acetyltransferase n=1 Tax=Fibroporia radiculosa TaxID=599839 RepID=J4GCE7_9APHY|nr:uncharacterized protein FIBRA_06754 [Fibroporia radiculosa]CCM04573.1 predicted protein [Fibroporia radiculosa]